MRSGVACPVLSVKGILANQRTSENNKAEGYGEKKGWRTRNVRSPEEEAQMGQKLPIS